MLHWLSEPWVTAGLGSMIGGAFAFFIAVRCIERAAIPHVIAILRERDAAIWKALQQQAHDLDTLGKTQALESEWHNLARELAEQDGREAGG